MKLRELKHGPIFAWPPMFGGAYRAGDRFPVGEVGVLRAVENAKVVPGLQLEIEYEGRPWSGILQWDGEEPSREKVKNALRRHIGEALHGLGVIEIS